MSNRNSELDEVRRVSKLFISPREGNRSVGAVPVGARESGGLVIPEAFEETPLRDIINGPTEEWRSRKAKAEMKAKER